MRAVRSSVLLTAVVFALPITCARPGDGVYSGGIEPSPAGRVNPEEPGFAGGGAQAK